MDDGGVEKHTRCEAGLCRFVLRLTHLRHIPACGNITPDRDIDKKDSREVSRVILRLNETKRECLIIGSLARAFSVVFFVEGHPSVTYSCYNLVVSNKLLPKEKAEPIKLSETCDSPLFSKKKSLFFSSWYLTTENFQSNAHRKQISACQAPFQQGATPPHSSLS